MTASNLLAEIPERRAGFFGDNGEFISAKLGDERFDVHSGSFARRKSLVKPQFCSAPIHLWDVARLNSGMNRFDCRKQWLRVLRDKEESAAEFAEKIGTDESYLSSILGPKAKRNVGDDLARRTEKAYSLPAGALDLPSVAASKLIKAAEGLDEKALEDVIAFAKFKKASKN